MNEFMVALQESDGVRRQVFYVLCRSADEAVELTTSAPNALADVEVFAVGPVQGSTGLNLQPNVPVQWI